MKIPTRIRVGAAFLAIALTACSTVATSPAPNLAAVLADPIRPAADVARDVDRKPVELMEFAGVRPGVKVAELAPGGGYFTRLLTGAVGPTGHVYAFSGRASPALQEIAGKRPNLTVSVAEPGTIPVPEPVDIVWTTLNYHDFKNNKLPAGGDVAQALNAAAFRALKPGGIYLIVDHETAPGAGASQTSTLHRIEDTVVRQEVQAAGFVLDAESNLLRHPADDHSAKVQETGIRGKTDQFVLKFRKPG
ncbi:MAG: class I SAM-dependent methyltransferase [Sphingomicrobium sp.]